MDTGGPTNDQILIAGIRDKNKTLFEAVYNQYYKSLYLRCYHYVSNHELAEEIVHDVFINLWSNGRQLTITHSLKGYLFKCVINGALNHIKKEKTNEGRLDQYSRLQEAGIIETGLADETEELYVRLEHALRQLPPQCKTVILLSKFEKLKQQEIAGRLGISIKTVKNHLTYGYSKIRSILLGS
jgi:RNA polymerase sigma-70 factor (ECF subfamily)